MRQARGIVQSKDAHQRGVESASSALLPRALPADQLNEIPNCDASLRRLSGKSQHSLRARDLADVLEVSINITQQECDTSPTRADKPQAVRRPRCTVVVEVLHLKRLV